jgi:hypothetical protein
MCAFVFVFYIKNCARAYLRACERVCVYVCTRVYMGMHTNLNEAGQRLRGVMQHVHSTQPTQHGCHVTLVLLVLLHEAS